MEMLLNDDLLVYLMEDINNFHSEQLKHLSKITDSFSVNFDLLNKFDLVKELEKTVNSEVILNNLFLTSQLLNNLDQKERCRYLIMKTRRLRRQILDSLNRKLVY